LKISEKEKEKEKEKVIGSSWQMNETYLKVA